MAKPPCTCLFYEPGCVMDQCDFCKQEDLLYTAEVLERDAHILMETAKERRKKAESLATPTPESQS